MKKETKTAVIVTGRYLLNCRNPFLSEMRYLRAPGLRPPLYWLLLIFRLT